MVLRKKNMCMKFSSTFQDQPLGMGRYMDATPSPKAIRGNSTYTISTISMLAVVFFSPFLSSSVPMWVEFTGKLCSLLLDQSWTVGFFLILLKPTALFPLIVCTLNKSPEYCHTVRFKMFFPQNCFKNFPLKFNTSKKYTWNRCIKPRSV